MGTDEILIKHFDEDFSIGWKCNRPDTLAYARISDWDTHYFDGFFESIQAFYFQTNYIAKCLVTARPVMNHNILRYIKTFTIPRIKRPHDNYLLCVQTPENSNHCWNCMKKFKKSQANILKMNLNIKMPCHHCDNRVLLIKREIIGLID